MLTSARSGNDRRSPSVRARTALGLLAAALVLAGLLGGCTSEPELVQMPPKSDGQPIPSFDLPPAEAPKDPRQVLSLVPAAAETVTLTNYVAIRQSNGFPGLNGTAPKARREAFWQAAERQTVLLTDGLLRPAEDALAAYGFGPDDVQFEVRFDGPDGDGFVLGLRPGVNLERVRRAVDEGVGPLAGATVLDEQFLIARGRAAEGVEVWSDEPDLHRFTSNQSESTYLHRGCIPLDEALGPDATAADRAEVTSAFDLAGELSPVEVFSVSFDRAVATGRLGMRRTDLIPRTDITERWPNVGRPAFADGFTGLPLFDTTTGRVGLTIRRPAAAARLTLQNRLPFAVCDEG